MTLKDILNRCGELGIHEERCVNDEYCELVFYNRDIVKWNELFADILGVARKPKGISPSKEDLNLTKASGGIRIEQTLFEKKFDTGTVIAKFWPWRDDIHITLKMAFLFE